MCGGLRFFIGMRLALERDLTFLNHFCQKAISEVLERR